MTEPCAPNTRPSENEADHAESATPAPGSGFSLRDGPLGLSLGVHIGTLVGVILFAGMYSLFAHELRIATTVFLAGIALGLAGGMVVALTTDAQHLRRQIHESGAVSSSCFWEAIWEGLGVGLGILLGTLPVSLTCSLFYRAPIFPEIVYVVAGVVLTAVGVVRSPSFRTLPSAVAYALLPGLVGVLVAHIIGDILNEMLMIL